MPSPVRYAVIVKLLKQNGWVFQRSTASHFIWSKAGIGMYSVPVHKGMVKHVYLREIQKINNAANG